MNHNKYKTKYRYILALGHLCSDLNQGTLSAILPFLIAAYHYNYTTAATLVMVSNIVGSVIQPVFGHLADKRNKPYIMTIGVLLAGGGMALTGFITNFLGLCIAVMVSGIGIAMFHPQAAQLVNRCSDAETKGFNLGVFSFGGNLGFTLGPVLATGSIALFGLKGTFAFLLPSLIFGTIATFTFKENTDEKKSLIAEEETTTVAKVDQWKAFAKLSMLVVCRSIINSGINTFLVLYFVGVIGQTKTLSNTFLSIYYAITAISALLGGKLADSFGYRKTLRLSFTVLLPSIFLFAYTHNLILAVALLLPIGIGISLCYSPMVLLGQLYLPNHMGLASGVTLGLAVSVGGIVSPLFGKLGDLYGLTTTFFAIGTICVIPYALSFLLSEAKNEQSKRIGG